MALFRQVLIVQHYSPALDGNDELVGWWRLDNLMSRLLLRSDAAMRVEGECRAVVFREYALESRHSLTSRPLAVRIALAHLAEEGSLLNFAAQ